MRRSPILMAGRWTWRALIWIEVEWLWRWRRWKISAHLTSAFQLERTVAVPVNQSPGLVFLAVGSHWRSSQYRTPLSTIALQPLHSDLAFGQPVSWVAVPLMTRAIHCEHFTRMNLLGLSLSDLSKPRAMSCETLDIGSVSFLPAVVSPDVSEHAVWFAEFLLDRHGLRRG